MPKADQPRPRNRQVRNRLGHNERLAHSLCQMTQWIEHRGMIKETECREFAAQCRRVAASAIGEAERTRWLDMAQQWMKWAELEHKKEEQK
jgi:hypothetical protein